VNTVRMGDANQELADFLRKARARIDPARAGLPPDGRIRRVPGLRREEVALLAGVSTDYYTRLEQGRRILPSPAVVDAIARALGLDAAGQAHLRTLIGPTPGAPRRVPGVQRARPDLHQFVDTLEAPAMVLGRRTDVLAGNRMAWALLTDFERMPARMRNYARWMFLSDEARELFVDWDLQARAVVENLRLDIGNEPDDPAARELIADLACHSDKFLSWWEEHAVYQRTSGTKHLRHPIVGPLTVHYETLLLPGDQGQTLFIYTTEEGTDSRQAMNLLASWTLTPQPDPSRPGE
jgi:transcriptional regulator with XRE-family HTH domain